VRVVVFEPTGERRRARAADVPAMTPGRAALVGLVDRYLRVGLDPIVTLLEIHKLMYFLQEAGEPLRLTLRKAPYGPSAENLRHVMRAVEGHFFSGYDDGGDDPYKEIEIVPGAAAEAEKALAAEDATRARFDRVVRLIEGFEAPSALELLATTHWVCAKEGARGLDAAIAAVHAWNERKRQFSPRQIGIAHAALASHGWLPA
jgi:O-acetyl-ADP-ribose deacetylase (regulator of RNase III)